MRVHVGAVRTPAIYSLSKLQEYIIINYSPVLYIRSPEFIHLMTESLYLQVILLFPFYRKGKWSQCVGHLSNYFLGRFISFIYLRERACTHVGVGGSGGRGRGPQVDCTPAWSLTRGLTSQP